MTIDLPYPPSTNALYLRTKRGGVRLNPKMEAYRLKARVCVPAGTQPMTGRLEVSIEVTPPDDHRKHDLDNLLKCVLDSLQACRVYLDDEQIDILHVYRHHPFKNGALEVVVSERGALSGHN